jgi:polyferredoxin
MKKIFNLLFKNQEQEFTKKWISRFTLIVFILLLFYIVLSQELLYFHFTKGLSNQMCKLLFTQYSSVVKVLITGYSVTFISSMAKAFMAKQQEEANRTKIAIKQMDSGYSEEE